MKTLSKAERCALSLLEERGLDEPPIDVASLADDLGVTIVAKSFEGDISGMLYRDAATKIVGVNAREPITRRRFTIAHELGHLLMHRGKPLLIERSARVNLRDTLSEEGSDWEEIQANQFAAELLMPRHVLFAAVRDLPATVGSERDRVRHLAELFSVSKQAMQWRLANLGLVTV